MNFKIGIAIIVCTACSIFVLVGKTSLQDFLTEISYQDTVPKVKLRIKDEAQYSKGFVESLRHFVSNGRYKEAELTDSLIFFTGRKNTPIHFPSFPRIKQNYLLKAAVSSYCYELELFRKNYSDIEFHIVLKNNSETVFDKKGTAIINPSFIQAGELYDDEISGLGYTVFHYESDKTTDDCAISISVSPLFFEGQLKAKIEQIQCSDSAVKEMVSKRPTLRTKT